VVANPLNRIERVLIDRLRSGAYGDRPLNVEANVWKKVLRGLEKEGQATRDEDLDEGIEEEDEENEYEKELEEGVGEVEYVSDIEGESDDDLEDFEDWMGGHSADEDEDDEEEDEESESGSSDKESEEDDASEDDDEELKKSLANLKRKRPTGRPPKPKKKQTKDPKGPRREIEYVIEREPPVAQTVRS
jgi:protein MAK16